MKDLAERSGTKGRVTDMKQFLYEYMYVTILYNDVIKFLINLKSEHHSGFKYSYIQFNLLTFVAYEKVAIFL
jgi:hypothetical protein